MRDYRSFSSVAKSRFRRVAEALGYEQRTSTCYAKRCDGWYEVFNLQSSTYGNDFFYVNYGIAVPALCPASPPSDVRDAGLILWERLRNVDASGGFDSGTRAAVEESAERVLEQYRVLALPWFAQRSSWEAIAAEYLRTNPIEESMLGRHAMSTGADFRAAIYGCLLYRAGQPQDALRWLRESRRLLLQPDAEDAERLREVEETIRIIDSETEAIPHQR